MSHDKHIDPTDFNDSEEPAIKLRGRIAAMKGGAATRVGPDRRAGRDKASDEGMIPATGGAPGGRALPADNTATVVPLTAVAAGPVAATLPGADDRTRSENAFHPADAPVVALCGISTSPDPLSHLPTPASSPRDRWLVYVPRGDRRVPQTHPDGSPYELRVHPSPLSARRMEAARRQMMAGPGVKPYTDYDHEDREASGAPLRFAWHDDFGVLGLTRLTAKAVERTTGEPPAYQSFSPHVPMDPETGEAAGLYANCGGFVNRGLFGAEALLSATAKLPASLVAANPNDVARIRAALDDDEPPTAAQTGNPMKELKARLCAAWTLDPETTTEAALIAAFEQHQTRVAALTAKAAPGNVIALQDHAAAIATIAVKAGIISPAEREITVARLTGGARDEEFKALVARPPTVPLGTVVHPAGTAKGADGSGPAADAWEAPLRELIARDSELSKIAIGDSLRARSLGLTRLMQEQPELFKPAAGN